MKTIYLLFISTLIYSSAQAQEVDFEWAKRWDTYNARSSINKVAVDSSNNLFLAGSYWLFGPSATLDLDPGAGQTELQAPNQNQGIFYQKLDPLGTVLWTDTLEKAYLTNFCLDKNNNLYSVGTFKETVDFDRSTTIFNLTADSLSAVFIKKLDTNGNLLWAKKLESNGGHQSVTDLEVDHLGNVYITGYFSGLLDIDPSSNVVNLTAVPPAVTSTNSLDEYNAFILKLDANGNFIWGHRLGNGFFAKINNLAVDDLGNVFTVGSFRHMMDFDFGPAVFNLGSFSASISFLAIQKIDANGNFIWAKKLEGQAFNEKVIVDHAGGLYLLGYFRNSIDFDPSPSGIATETALSTSNTGFILKLDTSGTFQWVNTLFYSRYVDCAIDQDNQVYALGTHEGTTDFDPSSDTFLLPANRDDIFIQKLTAEGDFKWAKTITGEDYQTPRAIDLDGHNNVFIAGQYQKWADFDPSAAGVFKDTTEGSEEGFLVKLSQGLPNSGTDRQIACHSYTWTNGVTYTSSNNMDSIILAGAAQNGLDSILRLDLHLTTIDTNFTLNNVALIADELDAQSYCLLDCNNNFQMMNCSTTNYLAPIWIYSPPYSHHLEGTYAVAITKNGCKDTTSCVQFLNGTWIGVTTLEALGPILIYPNPTTGVVHMDLGKLQDLDITVYNAAGQTILNVMGVNESTYSFELGALPGVYIIELKSDHKIGHYKLLKH